MTTLRPALVSGGLYLIGTLLLLPGTFLLLEQYAYLYETAIDYLIMATSILTLAAAVDFLVALFPPPPTGADMAADPLLQNRGVSYRRSPDVKELVVPYLMLQGGGLFLIGSLLYLPQFAYQMQFGLEVSTIGTWVFRFGTLSYMTGSFVSIHRGLSGLVAVGVWSYVVGAFLYLLGGIISQASPMSKDLFAETWIAGSVFFVLGALLLLVATVRAP